MQKVDINDLSLPAEDIYRVMGYGDIKPDENICNLVAQAMEQTKKICKPSYYFKILPSTLNKESIVVDGTEFHTASMITKLLRSSNQVAVFVATAGREFQDLLDEKNEKSEILDLFILDAIGTCVVEAAGDYMELQLEKEIQNLKHTNRFSPGYCAWDIVEQHKLFAMLPDKICGIELGPTSLMYPIKSISGIVGIGEKVITKKYGCSICNRMTCHLRHAKTIK